IFSSGWRKRECCGASGRPRRDEAARCRERRLLHEACRPAAGCSAERERLSPAWERSFFWSFWKASWLSRRQGVVAESTVAHSLARTASPRFAPLLAIDDAFELAL